ncbi:hypothetical protein PS862_00160 [Pseudomonas fluorescens]|uniref:Uncharacterized protein n=1 Tax=Pseudomonas fluorescens TaxID=294 RepID=A0A5E6RBH7_PSEFL|nr:GNAT family N-acetyltransferase [Pseudomonas fluorescens]VVM66194.1 hypothetical protein PS639_01533 [Pseudomonas fluorescens]VVO48017.1 hypothetical protein PS862_00160 [Pseudomonas fluorescens]
MALELRPATLRDLEFARTLTCDNMLHYYVQHNLPWLDEGFDVGWAGRENWLIVEDENVLGYVSLSRDARDLYIRELHVVEAFRGQGVGSWVIDRVVAMACRERRRSLRLTVFQDNPARALYERKGLTVVDTDGCFLEMQREIDGLPR